MKKTLLLSCFPFLSFASEIEEDQSRQQVWQVFGTALEEVSLIDEPLLRIVLNAQVVEFLWKNDREKARNCTVKIIENLEILDISDKDRVFVDTALIKIKYTLLSLTKKNANDLFPRVRKLLSSCDELRAITMSANFDEEAYKNAQQVIKEVMKADSNSSILLLFMYQLKESNPQLFKDLLTELLLVFESGQASTQIFVKAFSFYREEQGATAAMISRFLVSLVAHLESKTLLSETDVEAIYLFINNRLRYIDNVIPAQRIQAILSKLSEKIKDTNGLQLEIQDEIDIEENYRPDILIKKAEKDSGRKTELLFRVIQLYLQKRDFEKAISTAKAISEDDLQHGQSLAEITETALKDAQPEIARQAALTISPRNYNRLPSLLKIARYFREKKDDIKADELLEQIRKECSKLDELIPKINYQSLIIGELLKSTSPKAFEEVIALYKMVNSELPLYIKNEKEKNHSVLVQKLISVLNNTNPLFQRISEKNSTEAFYLANSLNVREVKVAALFGACLGALTEKPKAAEK
ncbi:MAG: hypothetical protein JNN15_11990 [Blastocatellia bacterium]|nr:hypothetical protein [Blastocatellia bacterium]